MSWNDARSSPHRSSRARWVLRLSVFEIALTVLTSVLVTLGGSSDAVSCSSFPGCLASQSTLIATLHPIAAGILLLVSLVIVVIALPLRRVRPPILLAAVLALATLVTTATFGMLFASGTIPLTFAPIQYVFLALVVALFAYTSFAARRLGRVGRDRIGVASGPPPVLVP